MYRGRINKLDYLMAAFGVSGKSLAAVLHVDYTLVSKWRNSSRQLTSRSSHLKRVASYFMSLDDPPRYPLIRELLREVHEGSEDLPKDDLVRQFALWLSDPRSSLAIDNQTIVMDRVGKHYTAKFDVYRGNQGRRQAVIRFLDTVLALPPRQNLFLHSQEEMAWLLEDEDFLRGWRERLAAIIAKGDQLTIIHTLNRDARDIAPIVSQWLPLHLSGGTSSYFIPRYPNSPIRSTCFLIDGVAAISGMTVEGNKQPLYTAYYTDAGTIANQQAMFDANLRECRPLLTPFPLGPNSDLLESFIRTSEKPYGATLLSPLLSFPTMPRSTLEQVLRENEVAAAPMASCLQFHDAMQHQLLAGNPQRRVRNLCDPDALEQAVLTGENTLDPCLAVLADKALRISSRQLREHLERTVHLLRTSENYELGLLSTASTPGLRGVTIWIKENEVVSAIAPQPGRNQQYAILAKEPTVVSAFAYYFQRVWESIPRVDRDRQTVIERIGKILAVLQA